MTRGEIITEALNLAGNPNLTTRAQNWLNYILHEIYSLYPWRFLIKNISWMSSAVSYDLPTDFLYNLNCRITQSNTQETLNYISLQDYDNFKKSTNSTGRPVYYCIDNETSKIIFYPAPDTSYTFDLRYLYLPTDLTSDTQSPVFPLVRILIQAVYVEALKYLDDERYLPELGVYNQMMANFRRSPRVIQYDQKTIPLDSKYFSRI